MSTRFRILLLLSALVAGRAGSPGALASSSATQPAPASGRVRVARLQDTRGITLAAPGSNWEKSSLNFEVRLQVSGFPLDTASGYGNWVLAEAVDGRGSNLNPIATAQSPADADSARQQLAGFTEIDRDDGDELKVGPDGFAPLEFRLVLANPNRHAVTLRHLAGHFCILVGGRNATARFENAAGRRNQTFQDSILQSLGMSLTLEKQDPTAPQQITFTVHGDPGYGHSSQPIDVVGSDGKSVVLQGSSVGGLNGFIRSVFCTLARPLDVSMTVLVQVRLGEHPLQVPFDLRDVPLP